MTSMVSFLLDGPISTTAERRQEAIERMASDLVEACDQGAVEVLGSDQEACRMLFGRYRMVDVALLAGEARARAQQEIVGREMSRS